jgi:carboxylate-amine ligase
MPIAPPSLTLGLEEEYLLVDPVTRDLVASPPAAFMARCKDELGSQVGHELLQAQVEVGTPICHTVADVRRELIRLRQTVGRIAAEFDMAIIAVSTHPFARCRDQQRVRNERYDGLCHDMKARADRMLICGMHVHAGIEDDDLRIDLMSQVTYFLPHLLALSTSSPFWEGADTGLKSYRPTVFGDLPRTGLPEYFANADEWRDMLRQLKHIGLCDDPTKIWWDLRPSARFPTLELRVCDVCTQLEDTVTIAALYQAILAALYRLRAQNQTWRRYRLILIAENKSLAQRHGIDGTLADFGAQQCKPFAELLEEIIELVQIEAARWGCLAEVENARRIIRRGTSADRQLSVFTKARADGGSELEAGRAVVDWLIRETLAEPADDVLPAPAWPLQGDIHDANGAGRAHAD